MAPQRHLDAHCRQRIFAFSGLELASLREHSGVFEREMTLVHTNELSYGVGKTVLVGRLAPGNPTQQRLQCSPDQANLLVVLHHLRRGFAERLLAGLEQERNNVALFIFMMQRRSDGEISQDVEGRLPRLFVYTVAYDVLLQPFEKFQRATQSVMARIQHLKRLVEARRARFEAWERGSRVHWRNHLQMS